MAKVEDVFAKSDMIVKVKEPLPVEWPMFKKDQILYTYLHLGAAYAKELTDGMLAAGHPRYRLRDGGAPERRASRFSPR